MKREDLKIQKRQLSNGHRVYTVDVGHIPPAELRRRIADLKRLFSLKTAS